MRRTATWLIVLLCLAGAGMGGAQQQAVIDILSGQGRTGPYPLSWAGLEPASDSVTVNGQTLFRLLDYSLDGRAGTITFARPLRPLELARVSYRRLPTARPRPTSFALPLTMPMGSLLGANVQMSYLYQGEGDRSQSVVVGMQAERQGRLGALTSSLLVSQGQDPRTKDATRALALKLGGERRFRQGSFTASLTRADRDFAAGSRFGVTPGVQAVSLGGEYRASPALTATTTLTRTDNVGGADASSQKLALAARYRPDATLSAGTAYSLLRQETGGVQTTTRTLAYDLALARPHQPALRASRTLTLVAREGQAQASQTITDAVSVSTVVAKVASAAASHQVVRTGAGNTATTQLELGATVVPTVATIKAGYLSREGLTQEQQASAALDLTPLASTRIQATVAESKRPGQEVDSAGVSATLKPTAAITLGGSLKQRDYGSSRVDTKTASVALTPLPQLKLVTEYAENPEDPATGSPIPARLAKVELATQLGHLGLGGSYGRRTELAGSETRLSEVSMSLALGAKRRIYTAYRLTDSLRPDLDADTSLYRLGYTHDAGADFSLSLEAQVLAYRENSLLVPARSERRAEAKLNARF